MAEYDRSWSSHDRPMVEPWSSHDRPWQCMVELAWSTEIISKQVWRLFSCGWKKGEAQT